MDDRRKEFAEEYKLENFANSNAQCPECGYLDEDSWELDDKGIHECGKCGVEYWYEKDITVDFTTYERISHEDK